MELLNNLKNTQSLLCEIFKNILPFFTIECLYRESLNRILKNVFRKFIDTFDRFTAAITFKTMCLNKCCKESTYDVTITLTMDKISKESTYLNMIVNCKEHRLTISLKHIIERLLVDFINNSSNSNVEKIIHCIFSTIEKFLTYSDKYVDIESSIYTNHTQHLNIKVTKVNNKVVTSGISWLPTSNIYYVSIIQLFDELKSFLSMLINFFENINLVDSLLKNFRKISELFIEKCCNNFDIYEDALYLSSFRGTVIQFPISEYIKYFEFMKDTYLVYYVNPGLIHEISIALDLPGRLKLWIPYRIDSIEAEKILKILNERLSKVYEYKKLVEFIDKLLTTLQLLNLLIS